MTEARVNGWLKEVGARVKQGEELVEVESEKIAGAVEVAADGVLRAVLHAWGSGAWAITPDGAAVSIHLARPGELFAEASLFSERYHCDAIAEVDSEVWVYPKDQLSKRLHTQPESLWAFARELARRLQELRLRYELKQIRSATERVLQLLRMRCGKDGVFGIAGSLKDVAADVGLTHEAFYRALAALEKQGSIARSAGAIRLIGRRD